MASCSSPPKKRPKLSLKFMRKEKQCRDEEVDGSCSQTSSNARTTHSAPNSQSSLASSSNDPTSATITNKDSLLEVVRSLPPPYSGLQNLGNTCYLNSVLQALRFCPGFCQGLCQLTSVWEKIREELRAEKGDGDNDMKGCGREMQFVINLKKLYDKMSVSEDDYMADPSTDALISPSPDEVLETIRELNPMFQGFLQHDSQELLCCLLSYLLDACQKLKKQLAKMHPLSSADHIEEKQYPSMETSNEKTNSKPGNCKGMENDKAKVLKGESEDQMSNTVRCSSPVNVKLDYNATDVSGSVKKVSTVDCSPTMKNGTKTHGHLSQTPSNDSVVGAKSKTPLASCKTNGDIVNGFENHCRVDSKENSAGVVNGNKTPLANGKHETPAKKKRLGKFLVPANQSTLLSAFAPFKKDVVQLNGINTNLLESVNITQDIGIDGDLQSSKPTNERDSVCDITDERTSGINSINEAKSSPDLNGQGDNACGRVSPKAHCKAARIVSEAKEHVLVRELGLIQGLFQGALVLRTRCNECESYTERREEFQDISLPVRCLRRSTGDDEDEGSAEVLPGDLSLSWAISEFACVERLTDDNKYFCEHCRHHAEAERSMLFGELPPVLTIHLKRFSAFAGFLSADSTVSKINDHLATPLSLCLSQWCAKQCKQLHCKYNLCAVVMHSGVSSSSGHYISYVQIPDRPWPSGDDKSGERDHGQPCWGKFDDEKVSILTQQELASSVLHPVSSSGSAATPYLLFYRQVQETD